jgi:hypothetical protein
MRRMANSVYQLPETFNILRRYFFIKCQLHKLKKKVSNGSSKF